MKLFLKILFIFGLTALQFVLGAFLSIISIGLIPLSIILLIPALICLAPFWISIWLISFVNPSPQNSTGGFVVVFLLAILINYILIKFLRLTFNYMFKKRNDENITTQTETVQSSQNLHKGKINLGRNIEDTFF